MDLEILNQDLQIVENPGLEITDPRLDEISTSVEQARYLEAAEQVEATLSAGVYDIRIIGFYLYGVFLEQGLGGLKAVFQCLDGLLRNNWSAFGPVAKKDKHAQTSFRWLFNQMLKKFQYEESKKSDLWNFWLTTTSSLQVEDAVDAAGELRISLGSVLEDAVGPVEDALGKVVKWLQSFQQIVYEQSEAEPEPSEAEAETSIPDEEYATDDQENADDEYEPEERSQGGAEAYSADRGRELASNSKEDRQENVALVEGSYHLQLLMKKMEAFERLISEQKFPRAAVVAEDINDAIASFDPRLYFPKLFARFAFLQALHIGDMTVYDDHKQTSEWQALKEFYKVDLEGFIEF